ncbi:hypothetical protein DAPPUDRAFT_262369 [Daphnia pulex]|uniref:Major facilitator superfamily (MFS) profile domain-containing protein n=1 Tax=Daphnia pulex TaxID=6669 RepID=E9HMV5_DAPPU|nr:hypothetical protein DAPPUDRAFT_262369 [Daphnia pulex]|eukprot:EFX66941.1 hypothetical protein DAPPUDRAFT_262369 [Daphnia pulex]
MCLLFAETILSTIESGHISVGVCAGSLPWIAHALRDWRLFSTITLALIGAIVAACCRPVSHTPDHWCSVPELIHLEPSERRNLSIPLETHDGELVYSRCRMINVNFTQEGATVDVTQGRNLCWPTKPCSVVDGWDYDLSDGMYNTIVSESNLVCEDDLRANFAQAMFFSGAIVGILLFGLLADWYGRLPVLVLRNVLSCGAGVATESFRGFVDFVVCRFLVGMAYDLYFII